MAVHCLNFRFLTPSRFPYNQPPPIFNLQTQHFATKTKQQTWFATRARRTRCSFESLSSLFACQFSFPNKKNGGIDSDFSKNFKNLVDSVRSVFPGGSWWRLCDGKDTEMPMAKTVTVWIALGRMWQLIGDDKWVVYVAVASLIIAAVSEISMPSILAASIFSAKRGQTGAFYQHVWLLVMLCLTSGICRLST